MKIDNPMIQKVIETAKKNLKESDMLLPTFFIGTEEGVAIVGAEFSDGDSKDATANAVRRIAREQKADFVLFLSESWTIPPECAQEFVDNRAKYASVSAHPKAYEVVMFTLETKTTQVMGMAEILKGREMGEVKWLPEGEVSGRFTHFLGPKPVKH